MYPKYLDKSPLYSTTIEVRFSSKLPEDAVTGLMFARLSAHVEGNWQITPLPASQLPLPIRQNDPNLRYAPIQRLTSGDQVINVGPNVLSLESNNSQIKGKYPGWKEYIKQFKALIKKVEFIEQIERMGVRYINVFDEKKFLSQLNVQLKTGWEGKGQDDNASVVFFVERNGLKSKVLIATEATLQDLSGTRTGQIIDIDTYIDGGIPKEDIFLRVEEAHSQTKEIFYSLPSNELLKKMGPNY